MNSNDRFIQPNREVNKELVWTTKQLSHIFGLTIPVQFLRDMGIEPAAYLHNGNCVYWWKKDFERMKREIADFFLNVDDS